MLFDEWVNQKVRFQQNNLFNITNITLHAKHSMDSRNQFASHKGV